LVKYRGSFRVNLALRHARSRIKSGAGSRAGHPRSQLRSMEGEMARTPPAPSGAARRVDGSRAAMTARSSSAWDDSPMPEVPFALRRKNIRLPAGPEADQTLEPENGAGRAGLLHRREGPRRGLASLMRPQRPLPTVPFVKKPLRRSPNACRGDPGGNLPRWFHAHLHSSLAASALRPTHCLRLEQHQQPEQRHGSCQAFCFEPAGQKYSTR